MRSEIFHPPLREKLEADILRFLNGYGSFLSQEAATSTRAVGDAVETILSENIAKLLGEHIQDYSADFARRAMADLAFNDRAGGYYRVDVKTHRLDTKFNMPNLTSCERLCRFYEDDRNFFVILMVAYSLEGTKFEARKVHFVPIEFLSWDGLTIGALGWGQIQIANSNRMLIEPASRKTWMLKLCDTMQDFYEEEIRKITNQRIGYFERVKQLWLKKTDD